MSVLGRILIVGAGDLGRRFSETLLAQGICREIILAGRDVDVGRSFRSLMQACGIGPIRFVEFNAMDLSAAERLVNTFKPSLIIQCAAIVSPWCVATALSPGARAIHKAGFAAQLPFQLPIIKNIMTAAHAWGF